MRRLYRGDMHTTTRRRWSAPAFLMMFVFTPACMHWAPVTSVDEAVGAATALIIVAGILGAVGTAGIILAIAVSHSGG